MAGWIVALALLVVALGALCVWLWTKRRQDALALGQVQADAFSRVASLSARGEALAAELAKTSAALATAEHRCRAAEVRAAVEATPDAKIAFDLAAALADRRSRSGGLVGDRPGRTGSSDLAGLAARSSAVPPPGALSAGSGGSGGVAGAEPLGCTGGPGGCAAARRLGD